MTLVNNLGVAGANYISDNIKVNQYLKWLNHFSNKISFDGAKCIGQAIISHYKTRLLIVLPYCERLRPNSHLIAKKQYIWFKFGFKSFIRKKYNTSFTQ